MIRFDSHAILEFVEPELAQIASGGDVIVSAVLVGGLFGRNAVCPSETIPADGISQRIGIRSYDYDWSEPTTNIACRPSYRDWGNNNIACIGNGSCSSNVAC